MAAYYTKTQVDAQATVIGARLKTATSAAAIKEKYEANTDTNVFTDAEKAKLAELEGSKFLGTFMAVDQIPTVNAVAGSYADVDAGVNDTVARYIWDTDAGEFVRSAGAIAGETQVSIKTKYEANADTNAFTDGHKTKLEGLVEAGSIDDFTTVLDAAMA